MEGQGAPLVSMHTPVDLSTLYDEGKQSPIRASHLHVIQL